MGLYASNKTIRWEMKNKTIAIHQAGSLMGDIDQIEQNHNNTL